MMADPQILSRKTYNNVSTDVKTSENNLTDAISRVSSATVRKSSGEKQFYSCIEKLNILKELDVESERSIIDKYKICDRTLRRWKRERERIQEICDEGNTKYCKKIRLLTNQDLDEAVYSWFCETGLNGVAISGSMIKTKALQLNKELGGTESFKASDGWLHKWKARMKIRSEKITDETLSADVNTADNHEDIFTQNIKIRDFMEAQIFNFA